MLKRPAVICQCLFINGYCKLLESSSSKIPEEGEGGVTGAIGIRVTPDPQPYLSDPSPCWHSPRIQLTVRVVQYLGYREVFSCRTEA